MRGVGRFFKKFRIWIIIVLVAFLIITFVKYTKNTAERLKAELSGAETETALVEKRNLVETITATGTVESAKKRTVASTIIRDTKITSVNCEVGDYVQEGDVLVTFSYDSINKTIAQLQEDIAESKATQSVNDTANTRNYFYSYGTESITIRDLQTAIDDRLKELNDACSEYGDAKRKLEDLKQERDNLPADNPDVSGNEAAASANARANYDQLIEAQENVVSSAKKAEEAAQKAYDKAVQALEDEVYKGSNTLAGATETYQKGVITSNDNTKNLQRQLDDYKDKLDDYVITSPISGTVTSVEVEEDNSFAGGNLVTIQDCSTMYVSTEIDEYDIPSIKVGQKVVLKTDATRDDELEGVIDEIAATATATATGAASTSGNATYAVKVKITTDDDRLKLGMTAKLSIVVDEVDDVLTVPYDAVVDKGDGQYVVYALNSVGVRRLEEQKKKAENISNAIADMSKGQGAAIPDMSKGSGVSGNEAPDDGEEEENKTTGQKIKDFFRTAYYSPEEDIESVVEDNKIEIPVEVGMENDYYTQVMGSGIKEGMTVIVQSTEEADNPFEIMMGF